MMKWQKVTELKYTDVLWQGALIRLPSSYPYESVADFMLASTPSDGGLSLIVISGYKSGGINIVFPRESCADGTRALSVSWLQDNWDEWISPQCDINQAWVCLDGYPAPETLPDGNVPE